MLGVTGAGRGGDGRVSGLGSQCDPESWNLIVAALRRLGTLGLETLGQCCGHWVTITLRGGRGGAGAGRGEAAGTCVPSRGFRVVRESSNIGVAASKLPLKPKLEQVKSRTVGF